MLRDLNRRLSWTARFAAGALVALGLLPSAGEAQVLVANPFTTSNTGWVDPVPALGGLWRINLHNPDGTLMDTNNANPPSSGATTNDGSYQPDLLVRDVGAATATGIYDYSATMVQNDDDIIGLIWNYQDPDNYFRVGIRQQAAGSFGGTQGLAVQKFVGGVRTQISPNGTGPGAASPITQMMIDDGTPFDLKVAVNGTNYEVFFNGASVISGTDADLVSGRDVGIISWAQQADSTALTPYWGTEVKSISVVPSAGATYNESFAAASPTKWRNLAMQNSAGLRTPYGTNVTALVTTDTMEEIGNFGLDINNPWILQHSNGFFSATAGAPNIDFLGPAIVIDEPGNAAYGDYEMKVRFGTNDNDGLGVIVRAQDNDNFYRINFASQAMGAGVTRTPGGLSIQKVRNGVWTEIHRDVQDLNTFAYQFGAGDPSTTLPEYDLQVRAIANTFSIKLIDAETGEVYDYGTISDDSGDPLLTGTAGLTTWGTTSVYFSPYGGNTSNPFLTAINPSTELTLTIDRDNGNMSLQNTGTGLLNVKALSIESDAGSLIPASWLSVTNNYDSPGGTVDPTDSWAIQTSTVHELTEAESPANNGGQLSIGEIVNLGNAWTKSRLEDVLMFATLTDNSVVPVNIVFDDGPMGGSYVRSDLNTDGSLTAADWGFFYPNMLADLSSMTLVERALAGDLNGDDVVDVVDFSLFKSDYDALFGAGAFDSMAAGVPEPSTYALLLCGLAAVMIRRFRNVKVLCLAASCAAVLAFAGKASAVAYDFTTFTADNYTPSSGFGIPTWQGTATTRFLNSNDDATVLYSPDNVLGKKIIGRVTPGTDDDVWGFVLGYLPGDSLNPAASYHIIDWKGATQNFDFTDVAGSGNFFHDQTPAGSMPVGLALSTVTGKPTADEMWQHLDLVENPEGGVAELARGAVSGAVAYNRTGGSHLFEITYTAGNVKVEVDGQLELDVNGTFADGKFGLYSAFQGPTATWNDFEVLDAGWEGLNAVVDRSNGVITLHNGGTAPVEFDYYSISSVSDSLDDVAWDSLSEQNFQPSGGGAHQKWQEAGGSDSDEIAEVYLAGFSSLGGTPQGIGAAYDYLIDGMDLVMEYRLPSGLILSAPVSYINVPPAQGVPGDYNDDDIVNAADYALWRDNLNKPNANLPNDATGAVVDINDYNVWKENFGGEAGSGSGSIANIPEPSSLVLLSGLALVFSASRFGRRLV